ncbi:MAG: hypothetical protein WA865_21655 [Spirulinaceae cyanobacterium]
MIFILILFSQVFSHFSFANDGKVIRIPAENLAEHGLTPTSQIFFIHGIVKDDINQRFGVELSKKINSTITVINNGSSCRNNDSSCRKLGDFSKAFLNRFGNRLLGRGNEPIIKSVKQQLRLALNNSQHQEIVAIAHSEGGLILEAAISDLSLDSRLKLDKLKVVLMGSPLHEAKIANLSNKVGELQIFSNPQDPIICLQKNIWRWSSWFGTNPEVKDCVQNSDRTQHLDSAYFSHLENYLMKRN